MKIAIVLEATLGGIRKHVVDLVEHLSAQGLHVWFIYSTQRADQTFLADLKRLATSNVNCVELAMTKSLSNPANLTAVMKMHRLFRRNKIEVVHLHGAVAGALGRVAAMGCKSLQKIIYSPHGGVLHKTGKGFAGKAYVLIEKLLRSKKLSFIAVSSDEKEKLQNVLNLLPARVTLVHNGIDVQDWQKMNLGEAVLQEKRTILGLTENDFVVLYPALFLEAKGHRRFFQTFADCNLKLQPNVKILLAGHGPLQPAVEQLVQNLSLQKHVRFLGFVSDVSTYFQLADAVLLPSVNEAFGYVLLEAMVFGKPVFATRVGGIKDIVEHNKTGFLYDPADLCALVHDLNSFAVRRMPLKAIGRNSLEEVVRKFDVKTSIERIRRLYGSE